MLEIIGRVMQYRRRYGMCPTLRRLVLGCWRVLRGNRLVIFSCDLSNLSTVNCEILAPGRVIQKRAIAEVDGAELERIESIGYSKSIRRLMSERFAQGASLWLFRHGDTLAASGWTLRGKTMVPHYFPLGIRDAHLFDFFVFPEYRGRGINVSLVRHILAALALESKGRAFIEAADWNTAQLRSLGKMPFQKIGSARKVCLFGRTLVVWDPPGTKA